MRATKYNRSQIMSQAWAMYRNKFYRYTFAEALKSILRQDPDVLMIGEIRDDETAAIAVRAAITGHKV